MPRYHIRFRGDGEDQVVEAERLGEEAASYVFYVGDAEVGRVARDTVESVVDEEALVAV